MFISLAVSSCCILSFTAFTSGVEFVSYLSDEFIDRLNKQNLPWKAGRNFPANLTQADVERLFGAPPVLGDLPESPAPGERRTHENNLRDGPIPPEFDARQHFKSCSDIISVIPDQGPCAGSYAFTIPSVASDRLCIASHGKIRRQLSAEYVTACCKMCRYPDESIMCAPGLSSSTWMWVHKRGLITGGGFKSNVGCQPVSWPSCNHSPVPNDQPSCSSQPQPKPKCHTRCTNNKYPKGFFQDKSKFKIYYWLTEKVEDIQREILLHGPVVANIYIYSDLLAYKSGVYKVSGSATVVAYSAVKIIGWGEEQSTPYWLVVSTFGEKWGQGGTFKILRGRNEAIVENLVNAALPRGNFEANDAEELNAGETDAALEFDEDIRLNEG